LGEKKECYLFNKKIEFSLYRGNWNIGFVDLKIIVSYNLFKSEYFKEVIEGGNFDEGNKYFEFYLEIKPDINSMGETMRQINFYRDYIPRGNDHKYEMILVTKTSELKEIFESQGVYVYEYEGEQKKINFQEGEKRNG